MGKFIFNNVEYEIYDLPGTYSLIPHSKEEEVVRNFICYKDYDIVVIVCDAVCLERNLNLALQVLSICKNVILCVNLMDEAKKKNIRINLEGISNELNIPAIGITARKKTGFDKLLMYIERVSKIENIKNLDNVDERISDETTMSFVNRAEDICKRNIIFEQKDYDKNDRKIDRFLTSKLTGIPVMILLLTVIFWITLYLSNYPSTWLFNIFELLGEKITSGMNAVNLPTWLIDVCMNGVYKVLTWVISVMFPPMAIFFPLFTFLEDLGYLPRVAFNLDNIFKKCKACGKQALTMCMGFGCNACGVSGCRIIDSSRERLIAILTNNFVPCNGRFPTLISIISMFFVFGLTGIFGSIAGVFILTLVILIGISTTFLVSYFLSKTFLKGEASSFTLELPPYRRPQLGKIIVRSIMDRTLFVLGRAIIVAAPTGLIIWMCANIYVNEVSVLSYCTSFLNPFAKFIGLDGTILMAFILGFPANEIVFPIILMSYLSTGQLTDVSEISELRNILIQHGWTWITATCTMIFSLMHWPCSTTVITIFKETKSLKWTVLAITIPTIIGIILCAVINLIGAYML